jgi:hypothetical protein
MESMSNPESKRVHLNEAVSIIEEPVIKAEGKYKHVMAITLDARSGYSEGVLRCIKSREGDVDTSGFIDRSILSKVRGNYPDHFEILGAIEIGNQEEVITKLSKGGKWDFLGLEDPDIWIDEEGKTHLFFTMPFRNLKTEQTVIYLGHAVGDDLDSLEMTEPVLYPVTPVHSGAKEVSIAPKTEEGYRINLVESSDTLEGESYSVVRSAVAYDMGKSWQYGKIVLHPARDGYPWCAGHMSPGPLLPEEFVDLGSDRRLGILNGREASTRTGREVKYGVFSVGLMVYNYKSGEVEWISEDPLIIDPDARTITFASDFTYLGGNEGILYAHVDDSFVRAYSLNSQALRKMIPTSLLDSSI